MRDVVSRARTMTTVLGNLQLSESKVQQLEAQLATMRDQRKEIEEKAEREQSEKETIHDVIMQLSEITNRKHRSRLRKELPTLKDVPVL